MGKFKVGDYVIFTAPNIGHRWAEIRANKTIGKVTAVTERSGMRDLIKVDYPDWSGTTSGADQLELAFRPGTRIRGKHRFGDSIVTGDVLSGFTPFRDHEFVRVRTLAGPIKHVLVDGAEIVKLPGEVLADREDIGAARRGDMHTLGEFPAQAKVLRFTGSAARDRKFLHRVEEGQDLFELSHHADTVDGYGMGRKDGAAARRHWFTDQIKDFEIVSEYPTKEEEIPTMTDTAPERAFIGKAPEVEGPKYQTPFRGVDCEVQDRTGKVVATVDLEHDYEIGEDGQMADVIATALNEKFDPAPVEDVFVPRTLVKMQDGKPSFPNEYTAMFFAYEVAPGRFWWAKSLADAKRETDEDQEPGWTVNEYDDLYDVTDPKGPKVITE